MKKILFIAVGILSVLFGANAQNNYQSSVIAESDYQWTGMAHIRKLSDLGCKKPL
ncbi:MAG: hypothetical protein RRZ66_04905 [Bacteroidales bacterium]